ncbi:precorrin-6y C5,15-methyltransferase, cbiE subunit CbiE [Gottschalkia purinilytica]|uniref:Precorrin-6y C5,15-methyltransferase, cbiE subunit CbiE n=1 Tax=Gottschalkia purinilytica TaxID=1503 RepID=A0A0L0W7R3_GOTPU|nr:precorrin-6y C5,15-methyltransferase (decarboxylating) subunit CbiE [Gottschalkia purinilytica]KNF07345.1 precorrin-6y C5,15-methyltransferase, cbiE subunit CbiE [Gottschalkia purinilytica]
MIYLVGMGPGDIKSLTLEAVDILKGATKIVSFGRISNTAKEFNSNVISIKRVDEINEFTKKDENLVILASGDPCFFGILDYLKRKEINIDKVIPGISSLQYMMAKVKKSWQDCTFVSLHGRDEGIEKILKSEKSFILTDSRNTPNSISKMLKEKGLKGKLYVGFNLSYENEKIVMVNIGEEVGEDTSLAVVVVENEMD